MASVAGRTTLARRPVLWFEGKQDVLKEVGFEVQVVDRWTSVSDGGRIGLEPEFHRRQKRYLPETSHSRKDSGACVWSRKFRLTKGAYMKRERVCQTVIRQRPFVRKAALNLKRCFEDYRRWLSSMNLRCIPESTAYGW